ncbi:hypothetical protein GEOBRER4_n3374 [Citrifermentans bremense]|uniref:Uncharacterized protein n=1 Tax=Citrifermentans bremense TaxID=60035 RepID=A0A7R7FSI1_9BACT|nr:hypothetical protein GEOBRER4_n3374 [Citrifermentans bremense]
MSAQRALDNRARKPPGGGLNRPETAVLPATAGCGVSALLLRGYHTVFNEVVQTVLPEYRQNQVQWAFATL